MSKTNPVLNCIWNIPICGGFCAPTENPEPSCLRHVSNEFTVPLAPRLHRLLPGLETNACCRRCGRTGLACGDRNRKVIGVLLALLNFTAMIFNFYAALGMTTNAKLLSDVYWVRGKAVSVQDLEMWIYIGVNAKMEYVDCAAASDELSRTLCRELAERAGFERSGDTFRRLQRWRDDEVCQKRDGGYLVTEEAHNDAKRLCEECKNAQVTEFSLVMGVFTQLPTLMTNLQRSTRFGDINCQASFGVGTNLFGLIMSLLSISTFRGGCFKNLPRTMPGFGGTIDVEWRHGPAFWLLVAGVFVKIPDAIGHLCIPTPKQRWEPQKQEYGHIRDYMKLRDDAEGDVPAAQVGNAQN